MQTFLPRKDYRRSLEHLDQKRLGKQRIESYQVLTQLLGIVSRKAYYGLLKNKNKVPGRIAGWSHHPIALMWKGHEGSLFEYMLTNCEVWASRGHSNKEMIENLKYVLKRKRNHLARTASEPRWVGSKSFHSSHRSNLLRKDKKYYKKFGWTEHSKMPYRWPRADGLPDSVPKPKKKKRSTK